MEEELSLDNILETDEIDDLFIGDDDIDDNTDDKNSPKTDDDTDDDNNKNNTTEVIDVDNLFTDKPEGVGSEEEDDKEKEDTKSNKDNGASPKNNFYSSIAKALKE